MNRIRSTLSAAALGLALMGQAALAETLTIAVPVNINTLDPHNSATFPTDLSLASHIYTSLLTRGPDLKLAPAAAESWEVVDDNTWRFKLRDGITFSNGEPLDAEAVKWNMERVLDESNNLRVRPWLTLVDAVEVIDPLTVEFHTSAPFPALADQVSFFFIVPPTWAGEHDLATEALGSGPYELESFTSGDSAVLKLRDDYWGEAPDFDEVVFRVMPEDSSRVAALLSGDVDFITAFPPSDVARLEGNGGIHASAVASTRFMYIKYNTLRAPLQDQPDVWRALNYAVDKNLIQAQLWGGLGEVAKCHPLSLAYFGYNDSTPVSYDYDPEKARELLAKAGYANGLEIELEVPTGRYIQSTDIAQIVAAQLAEVGVTVKITEMEFGRWMDKARVQKDMGDTAYMGMAWPTLDADGLLSLWLSDGDQAYYNNPDFDKLVLEARSTVDVAKRLDLYKQATDILCEAPPYISMFFQPITYAYGPNVEWEARGDDWVRAMDMHSK